jgi:hypothetical protein
MRQRLDDSSPHFLPSILDEPEPGLRYMKRRRRDRRDRNGDPLGGLALLFPLGLAFALAFVLAAFAGLGMQDLLTARTFTVVTDPGGEDMRVIVKRDGEITWLDPEQSGEMSGVGTLVGAFYRLADGAVVWVPADQVPPADSAPLPDEDSSSGGATMDPSNPTVAPSPPGPVMPARLPSK